MATDDQKAIGIAGLVGTLSAVLLTALRANAEPAPPPDTAPGMPPAEPAPVPSPGDAPAHVQDAVAPRTEFPWMAYSSRTLQIQQAINQWRDLTGLSRIAVDGILGPQTCQAWWQWYRNDQFASIVPPRSCNAYG